MFFQEKDLAPCSAEELPNVELQFLMQEQKAKEAKKAWTNALKAKENPLITSRLYDEWNEIASVSWALSQRLKATREAA